MALKGTSCNNLNAALLNPLNLGWFKTDWGPYCLETLPDLNPSLFWAFHLYDVIPTLTDVVQAVSNNDNYQRWWFVGGNEPDLNGTTPKQTKQLAVAQMDVVIQADPLAKFCLTMGSQKHVFGIPNEVPYIVKVWEKLEPSYRSMIRAFNTKGYPQLLVQGDGNNVYDPLVMANFCDMQNEGLMTLEGWPKNQFVWLIEMGFVEPEPPAVLNPLSITWMNQVATAIAGKCGRYAWYTLQDTPNYATLYEVGQLTPIGNSFKNIPPSI